MRLVRFILIIIVLVISLGTMSVGFADEQGGTTPGSGAGGFSGIITIPNPLSCEDSSCVLNKIVDAIIYISFPIATILILIGAFQIMFAMGDPQKVSTGRKTLLYTAIGVAVVLIAKSITAIIQSIFQ